MSLFEELKERREKLAVIGLGYVGMPLAVAFAEKINVLGFDLNKEKIYEARPGQQYAEIRENVQKVFEEVLK